MKRNQDGTVELTEAEEVVKDWHCSLLDVGHSHLAATEQMMLRTPPEGFTWKVLSNDEFRQWLYSIRFWGPLTKGDPKAEEQADALIYGTQTGGIN